MQFFISFNETRSSFQDAKQSRFILRQNRYVAADEEHHSCKTWRAYSQDFWPMMLNFKKKKQKKKLSELNESSGFMSIRRNSQARRRETTECNTANDTQPQPNTAAPMHWYTAREQLVNNYSRRERRCSSQLSARHNICKWSDQKNGKRSHDERTAIKQVWD